MIAKNFRRYAEAMLCQLELCFEPVRKTMSAAAAWCLRRSMLAGFWTRPEPKKPRRVVQRWFPWVQLKLLDC